MAVLFPIRPVHLSLEFIDYTTLRERILDTVGAGVASSVLLFDSISKSIEVYQKVGDISLAEINNGRALLPRITDTCSAHISLGADGADIVIRRVPNSDTLYAQTAAARNNEQMGEDQESQGFSDGEVEDLGEGTS